MTTAHRPTFDPARGKEAARGEAYHQRLLPAHKTLKYRQPLQGTPQEQARRDLKAELLRSEAKAQAKKDGRELDDEDETAGQAEPLRLEGGHPSPETGSAKRKLATSTTADDIEEEEDYETKKRRILAETAAVDADSDASSNGSGSNSDSDSEEEDETAQLLAELAKIKAERAAAAAKVAAVQEKKDAEQREKDIALGNPLLNGPSTAGAGDGYGVKRRWDDDVVFRNQGRGTEERGKEKRFVNDLLRSDFHRRFMDKYVR
ncbi:hypothetical protein LTR62_006186 [Meristemomyces frigidus]|uniref:Pre-mRNA-splicing factor CWC15 n=1 Tax=Meristemomyces frigidus TaxID=1508187 RepID=A0AAN7TCP0_9PEZI|nr:hypothetical protein LTR62_006186 [Meristemomyces frigidus]